MKNKMLILIMSLVLLLSIATVVIFLMTRKYTVTFDYNNETKVSTIKVKAGEKIAKEYIKTKAELGDEFLYWYEITTDKNGNEFVSNTEFNFDTPIKKNTYLKAKYVETNKITVVFDTKGGTSIPNIVLEQGQTLTLPDNPVKENYVFVRWEDRHGTPIYNEALLGDDITLYAVWEKENEQVSLSLTRNVIHPNSKNTYLEAKVTLENTSDKVSFTLSDTKCVSVDNKGKVTFKTLNASEKKACFEKGKQIKLTASLPSGKSASATFEIEKDLVLKLGEFTLQKNGEFSYSDEFTITSNLNVSWKVAALLNGHKYVGEKSKTSTSYKGTFDCKTNELIACGYISITATTSSGQEFKTTLYGG